MHLFYMHAHSMGIEPMTLLFLAQSSKNVANEKT